MELIHATGMPQAAIVCIFLFSIQLLIAIREKNDPFFNLSAILHNFLAFLKRKNWSVHSNSSKTLKSVRNAG